MSYLRQRRLLEYKLRHLGFPGLIGFVLVLAAASIAWLVIQPAYDEMDGLSRRISTAEMDAQRGVVEEGKEPSYSPAEQLYKFYQEFPTEPTIPMWLEKIYRLAGEDAIALETGEYSLQRAQVGRLNQYRIAFPLKGTYPEIRKFISKVLASAPAIALDSLQFKRESVGEGNVEARVVFLMYLEPNP